MAKRPDLDALIVPKDADRAPAVATGEGASKAYAHTLSLRLTSDGYRRLRRFVAAEEDRTKQRLTHQAIIESALSEWLDRHGG
jgi:hypothetical protein